MHARILSPRLYLLLKTVALVAIFYKTPLISEWIICVVTRPNFTEVQILDLVVFKPRLGFSALIRGRVLPKFFFGLNGSKENGATENGAINSRN